jgi:hypothetical protein
MTSCKIHLDEVTPEQDFSPDNHHFTFVSYSSVTKQSFALIFEMQG